MPKNIDLDYTVDILLRLLKTPSVGGNTEAATALAEEEFRRWGLATRRTNKGALLATAPGRDERRHRTLSGHVDTLGAVVKEVKTNGRLKLSPIGSYMMASIEGEHCLVETSLGRAVSATVLTTQSSFHVFREPEKLERKLENMEIRLDERVDDRASAEALGLRVGDFISFEPRAVLTPSGFIKSRHLDDKAGVAVLLGAAKYIADQRPSLAATTHFLITNYEEVGHGAATGTPPETSEFIAVDMGAVGAGQTSDEYSVSICAKDSTGPYHLGLRQRLVKLAEAAGISYRVDVYPFYGSDASAALRAGADIVAGLIGPGVDASHAHERTHREGLANTLRLVLEYLESD